MLKIKQNIPNAITSGNLLCGCLAIVKAFEGDLVWAAYLVGIAAVLDFFDGFFARLLKVSSPIGKDLDSLADMVTFGVVPGFILFNLLKQTVGIENIHGCVGCETPPEITMPTKLEELLPYIGLLVPIFSAIRLAKFNNDIRQSDSFIGVPTPANAILVCSLALLTNASFSDGMVGGARYPTKHAILIMQYWFLIPLIFIMCFLMISELPLFALKFKNFGWADNKIRYIFLTTALILLVCFQFVGIPIIILLYIIFSVVNNIIVKRKNSNA